MRKQIGKQIININIFFICILFSITIDNNAFNCDALCAILSTNSPHILVGEPVCSLQYLANCFIDICDVSIFCS